MSPVRRFRSPAPCNARVCATAAVHTGVAPAATSGAQRASKLASRATKPVPAFPRWRRRCGRSPGPAGRVPDAAAAAVLTRRHGPACPRRNGRSGASPDGRRHLPYQRRPRRDAWRGREMAGGTQEVRDITGHDGVRRAGCRQRHHAGARDTPGPQRQLFARPATVLRLCSCHRPACQCAGMSPSPGATLDVRSKRGPARSFFHFRPGASRRRPRPAPPPRRVYPGQERLSAGPSGPAVQTVLRQTEARSAGWAAVGDRCRAEARLDSPRKATKALGSGAAISKWFC